MATNPNQLAKTGKYGDRWRRLVFLLLALVVYRIGTHIPVPGIDPAQLEQLFQGQQGGILSLFNVFSGGALSRFTVFAGHHALHQCVDHHAVDDLRRADVRATQEEGEAGRRKVTQYTRYGTLGLALFQSLSIAVALESSPGW